MINHCKTEVQNFITDGLTTRWSVEFRWTVPSNRRVNPAGKSSLQAFVHHQATNTEEVQPNKKTDNVFRTSLQSITTEASALAFPFQQSSSSHMKSLKQMRLINRSFFFTVRIACFQFVHRHRNAPFKRIPKRRQLGKLHLATNHINRAKKRLHRRASWFVSSFVSSTDCKRKVACTTTVRYCNFVFAPVIVEKQSDNFDRIPAFHCKPTSWRLSCRLTALSSQFRTSCEQTGPECSWQSVVPSVWQRKSSF